LLQSISALGRLGAVEAAVGLVAGYGIRIVIVVQSLTQLRQLYDHGWENFLGNAAAVALVGPPADQRSARVK
jgi:type IV secretion system protein VirD4